MKERPIIFQDWKIPKIINGSATMTRRPMKPQPRTDGGIIWDQYKNGEWMGAINVRTKDFNIKCPYGILGDRLWGRETWQEIASDPPNDCYGKGQIQIVYKADYEAYQYKIKQWCPSIHMPRRASRIILEITSIKVEKVQDISAMDIISEGITRSNNYDLVTRVEEEKVRFIHLWNSIYGEGAWERNDWVWCISFRRID